MIEISLDHKMTATFLELRDHDFTIRQVLTRHSSLYTLRVTLILEVRNGGLKSHSRKLRVSRYHLIHAACR